MIYSEPCTTSPVERIAVLWAAPAAEAATLNRRITLSVLDESDYLSRVRTFKFGGCDECKMALTAWTASGLDAGIEAARTVFREGQLLALRLLDRCDVRAAINALADKLSEGQIVDGATCHDLLDQHLSFGSLHTDTSTAAAIEATLAEYDVATLEASLATAQQRRTDLFITGFDVEILAAEGDTTKARLALDRAVGRCGADPTTGGSASGGVVCRREETSGWR